MVDLAVASQCVQGHWALINSLAAEFGSGMFIRLLRIDNPDAIRFGLRDRQEAVAHAAMKIQHLTLEAMNRWAWPLTRSRVRASPISARQ